MVMNFSKTVRAHAAAVAVAALVGTPSIGAAAVVFHISSTFAGGVMMNEKKATNVATDFGTVFTTNDIKTTVVHNGDFKNGFAAISPAAAGPAGLLTDVKFTPLSGRFTGFSFRGQDVSPNQTFTVTIQDNQGDAAQTFSFTQVKANADFAAINILTTLHAKSIKYVEIQNSGGFKSFKQIQWQGPASAVPEPANWALMLTGFGWLGVTLRSRRRPAVAKIRPAAKAFRR